MQYINLDLLIEKLSGKQYLITAQSEMGEAGGKLSLTSTSREVIAFQDELAKGNVYGDQLTRFGKFLFQHLFKDEIRDLYRTTLGHVFKEEEKGMRLRLAVIPPEIAILPWELLYDSRRSCFLATSIKTPLVRYVNLLAPIRELKTEPPINVLITIPAGSGLDVGKEKEMIKKALTKLKGAVEFKILEGTVTTSRITDELLSARYHIFHFIGHGVFEGNDSYLMMNSETGESIAVSASAFARCFSDYPDIKLVVLNSCQGATASAIRPFAGLAPQLVREGIPAVIAMQSTISDSVAISFSRAFYMKLCMGWDRGRVDTAISYARNMIYIDRPATEDFAIPTLFMRSATGVIFDLNRPARNSAWRLSLKDMHRLLAVKRTREINLDVMGQLTNQRASETAAEIAAEKKEIAALALLARQWRRGMALTAASLLVFFAFWLGLFNLFGLDQAVERRLGHYFDAVVGSDTVMILAEEDQQSNGLLGSPGPDWRRYHAQMIDGLSRAGAKVIAFDLFLEEPTDWDQQLGQAIRQAGDKGTAVVLGARRIEFIEETSSPLMSPDLLPFIKEENWGTLQADPLARKLKLAGFAEDALPDVIEVLERPVVPSLALQVIRQAESRFRGEPLTLSYDAEKGQIALRDQNANSVRAIPVDHNLDMAFSIPKHTEYQPYARVLENINNLKYLQKFYKDKIVIIGYRVEQDHPLVSENERVYGVEIQASAISSLLNEIYIQRLRAAHQYLVILFMCVIALVLRTLLKGWARYKLTINLPYLKDKSIPVLLILVTVLDLLAAIFIYGRYHVVLAVSYHIAALWLAYWMIGLGQQQRDALA
jgi:CHASE2 domain-containing sensor protein